MSHVLFNGKLWEVNHTPSEINNMRRSTPNKEVKITCGSTSQTVSVYDIRPLSPFSVGLRQYNPIVTDHLGDYASENDSKVKRSKPKSEKARSEKTSSAISKKISGPTQGNKNSVRVRNNFSDEVYILDYSEEKFWAESEKHPRKKVMIRHFLSSKKVALKNLTIVRD